MPAPGDPWPVRPPEMRGQGDLAQKTEPDWQRVGRGRGPGAGGRAGGRRGRPASPEVSRRGNSNPWATTEAHSSYRVSGASEEGWSPPTDEIRLLFPPGTQNRCSGWRPFGSPLRPGGRKRGPGTGPQRPPVCAGAGESAREDGRGRGFCGPRLPSRGSWVPWRGRRWPAADPRTQLWELRQALCFSRSAQGPGEPCVFVW